MRGIMKPDWVIRIEMSRFFDRKSELRGRTVKGAFKDTIYRGVFASKLEEEFTAPEIKEAIKLGYISDEKIMVGATMRNIYLWLESECVYQPTTYKRWLYNTKSWLATHFISR